MPLLMYLTVAGFLGELTLQVLYATLSVARERHGECESGWGFTLTHVMWIISWVYIGFQLVLASLLYDTVGRYSATAVATQLKYDRIWRRRCLCFLWCWYKEQHQWVWDDVANFFGALFRFTDIVPSDIAAGIVLLRAQEKLRAAAAGEGDAGDGAAPRAPSFLCLPAAAPTVPPEVVHELAHFARYFMGCYGFRLTIFLHPLNGLCRLLPFCRPCAAQRHGDCCGWHSAALRRFTGCRDEDLLYVDNRGKIFAPPTTSPSTIRRGRWSSLSGAPSPSPTA
eukprot:TRINITY_DN17269_c0_g1_i1.p1 TRINITY_DN17269_c0_g1~~TRINITY_DN17269_c0_g1_i1.p1  ORF type:complete len:281 (+),score=89.04 TRINITY_DN17269_c0_g1_i1:3-845(+)